MSHVCCYKATNVFLNMLRTGTYLFGYSLSPTDPSSIICFGYFCSFQKLKNTSQRFHKQNPFPLSGRVMMQRCCEWREQMAYGCLTLTAPGADTFHLKCFFFSTGRSVDDRRCPISTAQLWKEASRWRVWLWRGGDVTLCGFCVSLPRVLVRVHGEIIHQAPSAPDF